MTRKLLFLIVALGLLVCARATALEVINPDHDLSFNAGGWTFGFVGFDGRVSSEPWTVICYGPSYATVDLPIHLVVTLIVSIPVLIAVVLYYTVRRLSNKPMFEK